MANTPKDAVLPLCHEIMRDGGSCQEHRGIMLCIRSLTPPNDRWTLHQWPLGSAECALIDDWAKATNIKVFNDSSNLHVYDHMFMVWSQNEDNSHGGEEGTVFFTGISLRDITKLLIKVRQDREVYRKGNGNHGRSNVSK